MKEIRDRFLSRGRCRKRRRCVGWDGGRVDRGNGNSIGSVKELGDTTLRLLVCQTSAACQLDLAKPAAPVGGSEA